MENYDLIILGTGPGGYTAALKAAQEGRRVCIIEKSLQDVGGVCLNCGCIPTKSLINSANIFNSFSEVKKCGIEFENKKLNLDKVVRCNQKAVKKLQKGLLYLFKKNNIELIEGIGKLCDRDEIKVDMKDGSTQTLKAENIVIATGARPKSISGIEIDRKNVVTSPEIIKTTNLPSKMVVVGGGAIGVEFASIFNSFGSEVTIIEMLDSLLPHEEKEITTWLHRSFKKKGIKVLTNTKLESLSRDDGRIVVEVSEEHGEKRKIVVDKVLISVGREPNTEDIGLEKVGVEVDNSGFIKVDKNMKTSVPNIYAVGDVIDTPMLAHVAFKEAEVCIEHILNKKAEKINYNNTPNAVYSEPEVARVGLTEEETKKEGYDYKVEKSFFKANPRAVTARKPEGLIKVIIGSKNDEILGVHILGKNATEIIHEFVVAKNNEIKFTGIKNSVHAHPTFSEIAVETEKY